MNSLKTYINRQENNELKSLMKEALKEFKKLNKELEKTNKKLNDIRFSKITRRMNARNSKKLDKKEAELNEKAIILEELETTLIKRQRFVNESLERFNDNELRHGEEIRNLHGIIEELKYDVMITKNGYDDLRLKNDDLRLKNDDLKLKNESQTHSIISLNEKIQEKCDIINRLENVRCELINDVNHLKNIIASKNDIIEKSYSPESKDQFKKIDALENEIFNLKNELFELKKKFVLEDIKRNELLNSFKCVACFDKEKSIMCEPCKHIPYCEDHAQTAICPICRTQVQRYRKVYI